MTSTFDQSVLSLESNKNLSCEAYMCRRKATTQLKVNVGVLGDVDLHLCKNCVPKFSDNVVSKNGSSHRSLPVNGKARFYHHEYNILSTA